MTTAPDALKRELAAGRERLLRAIAGVSEEQFKRRPPDSETDQTPWCIGEVLAHLLQQERLRSERIALALREDGAPVVPSTQETHDEGARAGRMAPVPQLIHGLLAARRQTERLIDAAAALDGGFERAVLHPEHGRQTAGWLLETKIVAHEAEHVAQIEALRLVVGAPPLAEAAKR